MRSMTKAVRFLLAACAGLGLLAPAALAQTVYGSMAGTVTDPSGAVISGAKVEAKSQQTGATTNTVTTAEGVYRFPELPLGRYDVTVTASGFQQTVLTGIDVQIQSTSVLNIALKVGTAATTVSVNANAPTLQTETSDIGGVVDSRQILDLPLAVSVGVGALRSPEEFMFLLPGTVGPGTANNGNSGVFLNKIAGGQNYGNEVLIDGVSQQRSENGSSFDEEAPSVEALQEFKLTTAMPEAEFGRTTGGIENFVTRSGGNNYHGDAYEILKNTVLDANLWFNGGNRDLCLGNPGANVASCNATFKTPVDIKNDYGGTLGGPVRIPHLYNGTDKLFFFFSWEQIHYNLGSVVTNTVPTAQELSGDFSNPAIFITSNVVGTNPCDGTPIYQGQIFDPSTTKVVNGTECRTAFPGNKIPGGFSPAAQAILAYFPAPTNNQVFNNYQFNSSAPITDTAETIRIDSNLSRRNKIWGSYSSRENDRVSGTPALPYPIDPGSWIQDFTTHFGRFGWDFSISPTMLNHFIFGTNRSNSVNYAQAIFAHQNWSSKFGIGNANSFNFPELTNGFTAQEGNAPQNDDNVDNGLRLVDSVSLQRGAHSISFGADIRYQQYSPIDGNSPVINFCGAQTAADPNLTGVTGNGLASELLGDACGGSQSVIPHQSRWVSWYWAAFVQDDWKVNQHLTFNLGVRYSVDLPRHEANNYTSNFDPNAVDPEYGVKGGLEFGTTCHCNTAWANSYWKDIAPRIGFAYAPAWLNQKTALRGGAGIMYGPLQYSDFGGSMNTGYRANPSFPSKNGFDPSFQIDSGYPAFAQPPDLDPGYFNGTYVAGSWIRPEYGRPAAIYQWDLQLQQQLATDLIATVGYIGNEAQNLHSNLENRNNISIADLNYGDALNQQLQGNTAGVPVPFPGYFTLWGSGVTVQQALRPFPQYDFIDTGCCLENVGHSSYDALVASIQRQFRNGFNLQFSYTWSKSITDADSLLPNNGNGVPQDQDVWDLHKEKSISFQDVPQQVVISYLYQLPWGRDRHWLNHSVVGNLIGGWELGGIQRYMSGQPMGFCCSSGIPGFENAIRFNLIPGKSIKSEVYSKKGPKGIDPFNTASGTNPFTNSMFNGAISNPEYPTGSPQQADAAFYDQNLPVNPAGVPSRGAGAFTLGDSPRVDGVARLPAFYDEDFSLLKDTTIHESLAFELKFEFINALNHHTWNYPDQGPADSTFGIPTSTLQNPRNIQVTGKLRF
jgi:Carboxypeptidase regulatory-like domain